MKAFFFQKKALNVKENQIPRRLRRVYYRMALDFLTNVAFTRRRSPVQMKLFLAKKKPQRKKKQIRASHKYYGNLGEPIIYI